MAAAAGGGSGGGEVPAADGAAAEGGISVGKAAAVAAAVAGTAAVAAKVAGVLSTREWVAEQIAAAPVVVFSKSYCPYCRKAKAALKAAGVKPEALLVLELEDRPDVDAIQAVLGDLTGATTVPRVFIGGKFVGGGDDTAAMQAAGKLRGMLEAVGAA